MAKRGPITIHGARPLYGNSWIRLTDYDCSVSSGRRFAYTVVSFEKLAAGVVPLHDDGTVTLVGQHRFPLDAYSWEIPEGGIEDDEEVLPGIQRELAEEAGLAAANWQQILHLHLSNSVTDEQAVVFMATGLSDVPASPDDTEDLALKRIPLIEALDMCSDGRITDAITVAGLLQVHLMAVRGLLPGDLNRIITGAR